MTRAKSVIRFWWAIPVLALILSLGFIVRYPTDKDSLKVFYHAGPNVLELLKTLEHFRDDPDPRKYEAAKYLIRNMDLYYTREDPFSDKMIQWASKQTQLNKDELERAEDTIQTQWASIRNEERPVKIRDCRLIGSETLIGHIDQAFLTWEASPWQHLFSFGQFCDHLLSYKTNHARPLLWLRDYSKRYQWIIDSTSPEPDLQNCISLAFEATETPFRDHYLDIRRHLDPIEMETLRLGDCSTHADWRGYVMRSLGIPVGNIYTPLWANKAYGHHWNVWMDSTGTWNEIMARFDESIPGKIFLHHFGKQKSSFRAIAEKARMSELEIPSHLLPWNISDITGQVVPASDLTIRLSADPPGKIPFVYLATFNCHDWSPVDWAEYHDSIALFGQVGRNALYLPVYYQNGSTYPAGEIFVLKEDGEIWYSAPDSSRLVEIELLRVYPVRHYNMKEYSLELCNASFEGSNDSTFTSVDTLYQIPPGVDQYPPYDPKLKGRYLYTWWWQDISVNSDNSYRYIRFKAPLENPCELGEMEVFDISGRSLKGVRNFGYGDNPVYLSDGFPGNVIRFENPGEWAAIDLGQPYRLSKIRYIPRDVTTASIQAGDTYTLFHWDNDWVPLHETVPEIKSVKINVHPNGLYMLKNTTTNGQSRPFIYNPLTEMVEWW